MALPIRSLPPRQRGLTLIHSSGVRLSSDQRLSLDQRLSSDQQSSVVDERSSVDAPDAEQTAGESSAHDVSEDNEALCPSGRRPRAVDPDTSRGASPSEHSKVRASEAPRSARAQEIPSDAQLVASTRTGESTAFERLYRRHAPYALALAVRVQGHAGDVEDIVHDAFLRVHDRLHELRADESFKPWLSSIVVSLVRTRLRRRRMLSVLGLTASEPVDLDALVTGDAGPEVRAQLGQVYSILGQVPVDQRICWTLRYLEGRKLDEVARLSGCSLATAKRRIMAVQERLVSFDRARSFDRAGSDEDALGQAPADALPASWVASERGEV